jgi:tellurite resistance protein TehA-like permease
MMLAPPVNRVLRLITLASMAIAALCLLYVWAELLHRWTLFRSYGSEPYVNHVDASYFVSIPGYATVGLVASLAGIVLALLSRRFVVALLCLGLAASAFYAPRLLRTFHESHILVTYEEYIACWTHVICP